MYFILADKIRIIRVRYKMCVPYVTVRCFKITITNNVRTFSFYCRVNKYNATSIAYIYFIYLFIIKSYTKNIIQHEFTYNTRILHSETTIRNYTRTHYDIICARYSILL